PLVQALLGDVVGRVHPGALGVGVAEQPGQPGGGHHDVGVPLHLAGGDDVEAAAGLRPAVGVHRDRRVGLGVVADLRPLVHARADPLVVGAGHHDLGAFGLQPVAQQQRQVQGELVLGVAARALRADGVAGLLLPGTGGDLLVDLLGRVGVAAVVAGVDEHGGAGEGAAVRLSAALPGPLAAGAVRAVLPAALALLAGAG